MHSAYAHMSLRNDTVIFHGFLLSCFVVGQHTPNWLALFTGFTHCSRGPHSLGLLHATFGGGASLPQPTQQQPKSDPGSNGQVSVVDGHGAPANPPHIAIDVPSAVTDGAIQAKISRAFELLTFEVVHIFVLTLNKLVQLLRYDFKLRITKMCT